jgi:H+/gluconate symporter-like permease
MPGHGLIPPHQGAPASWKKDVGFNRKVALVGAFVGVIVALVALFLGASPLWWLAVPAGFALGAVTSKSFRVPISWGRQ